MKHLFCCATIALALTACGGKDDKDNEPLQANTSFVITTVRTGNLLPNIVSGYFDKNGICRKIAEHGDMDATVPLGATTEEVMLDVDIDSVYIFTDFGAINYLRATRFARPFFVKKNKKNTFDISEEPGLVVVKSDSTQYPH